MASLPPLPDGYSPVSQSPRPRGGMFARSPLDDARSAALSVYPSLQVTDWRRDPNSRLGRANPRSWHVRSGAAIDARPLPGMSFDQYVDGYRRAGFDILEARDEVNHPSSHATGPHWHIALGGGSGGGVDLPPLPDGYSAVEPTSPGAPIPFAASGQAQAGLPTTLRTMGVTLPGSPPPRPTLPDWENGNPILEARAERTRAIAADVRRRAPFPTITTREWAEAHPEGVDPLNPLHGQTNTGGAVAAGPNVQALPRILQTLNDAFQRGASESELLGLAASLGVLQSSPNFREQLQQALQQRAANPELAARYSIFVPDQTREAPVRPEDREAPGPDATPEEVASWNRRRIATMQPGASITEYHPTINERVGDWAGYAARPVYGDERGAAQFGNRVSDLTWWSGIGALSDTAEYEERRQRALAEGRFLDAQGNELGAQISAAGLIPIVGPGARRLVRGGRSLVDRLLRRGEREVAEALGTDASRAAMAAAGAGGEAPAPRLPAMAMENEAAPSSIVGPSAREIDRIDVNSLPPLPPGYQLEPQIGRVAPLGEQPDPADLANVARSIRPEDVRPGSNRIESYGEAVTANPGTIRDVPDINPRNELAMRSVPTARGQTVRHRGPLDAEAFLRARGGVQDQGGDLRAMGFTNAAREGTSDRALGPIVNRNGLTLDEAGEALAEAGYLPDRPTTAEVIDILDNGRRGQRTYHPDDWEELERFDRATEQQGLADAAESRGSRLGQEVGEPIGPDDLDAMQPPAVAYDELPSLGGRVGNINLANIESETDIRRLLSNVEDRFGGFDAARRGSITHAETEALASELGMTADDLLRRRQGQALNAEQALAARQLLAKSSDEVARLAERAIGPEASDVSRAAFSEALLRHAAIHEQVSGATAEAGRALQSFRMAARSRAVSDRIHQAAIEGIGGQSKLEDIAEGILNLQRQGAGPGEANRFAVDAIRPAFRDKLTELWYNWLLSGPQTHAVNILSNAMTATLQLPEQAVASGLGQIRRGYRALRGLDDDFDRVMASELGPRVVGLMQGAREGLGNGARTFLTGEVPDFVTKVESRSQHAISGWKGSVIRTPTRALAAEDEFFKAVARRMELNGLAVRQARREGLRGEELTRRVADLTANPTDAMLERALDTARYLTFQRPLKGVPAMVSAATQRHPWAKLFLPFIRTPTNIFKFALERSPAAPILREVRDNLRAGGERRALALSRIALGTGVGLVITELASRGIITGKGPADRRAEAMMRADGWQPYSIRIGDRYYSYQRLDPLALTFGTAADLVGLQEHMTPRQAEEAAAMVITSLISNLSSKTFFSGVSDVVGAIDDPERNLPRFRQRLAGSLAVPAGVAQLARTIDPVQRDVRSTLDAVRARIPGLSQTLPARRDIWGREIVNEGGLGPDIASPIWTSTARNDPVTAELLRLGVNIGKPSRRARGGEYAADSYDRLQQFAGQYAHDDLAATMASPLWRTMSDDDRRREARRVVNRARDDARADLQNPEGAPRGFGRQSMPGPAPRRGARSLPPLPPGYELPPLPDGFTLAQ